MSKVKPFFIPPVSKITACLGLSCALALSGCSVVQVRLGMKVNLSKTPVTSMEASLPKDPGIAP